jgi:hypothetical protein
MALDRRAQLQEQYRAALQSYIFEGHAFWNRISAFVLLNSALLVARGALPKGSSDHWVRLGISILGLVTTLLWGHTAVRAHYIIAFWTRTLQDLEAALDSVETGLYTLREGFLGGRPVKLAGGEELRLPWVVRVNVNDSTSATLTVVFLAIWLVSLSRLA